MSQIGGGNFTAFLLQWLLGQVVGFFYPFLLRIPNFWLKLAANTMTTAVIFQFFFFVLLGSRFGLLYK